MYVSMYAHVLFSIYLSINLSLHFKSSNEIGRIFGSDVSIIIQ